MTNLLVAAKRDLEGVPRRTWFGLALLVVLEVAAAAVVLRLLGR